MESTGFGALGAYSASAGAKDITIDAAVAKANPSIFQHVALGLKGGNENIFYCCSASGPDQKVPHYQNPVLAYNMLFGKILGGNTATEVGAWSVATSVAASMFTLGAAWGTVIDIGGNHTGVVGAAMNTSGQIGSIISPLLVTWLQKTYDWNAPLLAIGGVYLMGSLA